MAVEASLPPTPLSIPELFDYHLRQENGRNILKNMTRSGRSEGKNSKSGSTPDSNGYLQSLRLG